MYGTTFPSYDGLDDESEGYDDGVSSSPSGSGGGQNNQGGQQSSNQNRGNWQGNQNGGNQGGQRSWGDKKPWQGGQNNQGGNQNRSNWQGGGGQQRSWGDKKPWQGGQGGGGGGQNRGNWQGGGQRNFGGGGGGGGFKRQPETDMSLYLPYAVTGNQNPPPEITQRLEAIVKKLDAKGFTARTGGFEGIEEIAEKATQRKEVHLPWRNFNGKESRFTFTKDRAMAIARMFHPAFDTMKESVQKFLAKNARIILGDTMAAPALFLLVWTEDGCNTIKQRTAQTGFAGHPIAIASALGIPVFNLGNPSDEARLNQHLDNMVLPTPTSSGDHP